MDDIKETGQVQAPTPKETKVELSPFEQKVFRDFYFSFKHSQGKTEVQRSLFKYLALQYRRSQPNQDMGSVDDLKAHLESHLGQLNLPAKGHKEIETTAEGLSENFASYLDDFCVEMRNVFEENPAEIAPNAKTDQELLSRILKGLVNRDLEWVFLSRPSRKTSQDLHESFLRTHSLEGKPTGSEIFDQLYRELRPLLVERLKGQGADEQSLAEANKLREVWEQKHEGQKFIPEPVLTGKPNS